MTLRADLHVHTRHSKHNGTMPFLGARDCYSSPGDVYRVARARGMEQMGWISSEWGVSDNNRRAKFYSITRAGKKQLTQEAANWKRMPDRSTSRRS